MVKFLKANYALVAGVALPLALIAVFFLAGKAAVTSVPDPQYDAVLIANYTQNSTANPYKFGIDDGKLYIRPRPPKPGAVQRTYRDPIVYRFDHKTLYAKKIDIDFDNVVAGKVSDPELDALNSNRINPDPISRDGYKFQYQSRSGGGLFGGLFGWRRHPRSPYVLRKGVRSVPVVGPQPIYSGYFIGWVEK